MPGIDVPIGRRLRRGRAAGQLNRLRFQPLAAAWPHRLGAAEDLPRVIAGRVCLGCRCPKPNGRVQHGAQEGFRAHVQVRPDESAEPVAREQNNRSGLTRLLQGKRLPHIG